MGPALGEDEAVLAVGVLCLRGSIDSGLVVVLVALHGEGDTVGRGCLDLQGILANGIVFAQQVVSGLADVLSTKTL